MPLTLIPQSGSPKPARIGLQGTRVVIGCGAASDLRLEHPSIKDEHAVVRPDGDSWVLEAVGPCSTGGVALAPGESRLLQHDVPARIGDVSVECTELDTVEAKRTVDLALGALTHGMKVGTAPDKWAVRVLQGKDRGATATVVSDGAIGRADGLLLALLDPSVSRKHVEVRVRDKALQVRDLDATQGTFLGGSRLAPQRWAVWPKNVALRIGDVVLACVPPILDAVAERTAAVPSNPEPQLAPVVAVAAARTPVAPSSADELPPVAVDEPPKPASEEEEKVRSAPGNAAPIAAAPARSPIQQTSRTTPIAVWIAGITLVIVSIGALVWILR